MATLALSANRDAILALKDRDKTLIQNVIDTYADVNRVSLYAIRQLKYGLEKDLFRELGFRTPKEFLGYRIVVNDLKSIADNAMNIVNNIIVLNKLTEDQTLFIKEPVDEEIYSEILNFNSLAHQLFEESLKALFKRCYDDADKTISQLESRSKLENDIITLISNKKLDPNISSIFRLMLDSSRRTLEYCRNTAEVTLNRTVEEISSKEAI
jgi:phosphate uptake regulator